MIQNWLIFTGRAPTYHCLQRSPSNACLLDVRQQLLVWESNLFAGRATWTGALPTRSWGRRAGDAVSVRYLWMYIYIYIYIIYIYIYTYIFIYTHRHIYTHYIILCYIYIYIYIYINTCVYTYIYIYIYMFWGARAGDAYGQLLACIAVPRKMLECLRPVSCMRSFPEADEGFTRVEHRILRVYIYIYIHIVYLFIYTYIYIYIYVKANQRHAS